MNTINIYATRYNEDRLVSLVKEAVHKYDSEDAGVIDSPEKAALLLEDVFDASNLTEEHFWLIVLDGARKVSGLFRVSHGTLMSSLVHPREVFSRAILCGAASIIVGHNHPSRSLSVSEQDHEVTRRIELAGELLGIKLDDHVICAGGGFVSAY